MPDRARLPEGGSRQPLKGGGQIRPCLYMAAVAESARTLTSATLPEG